jgi:hypothetical protein
MISATSTKAGRCLLAFASSASVAMAGVLATAPPAHAATAVVPTNGVIYDDCFGHPFQYSIDPAKAAYDWSLEVTVYDPRGVEASSSWLWKDEGDASSGVATGDNGLEICGSDLPGTWRMEAELNMYGGGYDDEILPAQTFTMSPAGSRATVKVNDASAEVGQEIRFTATVKGQFPNGYFPVEYAPVRLQKKVDGSWKTMSRATTDDRGVAKFTVRWKDSGRKTVRVLATGNAPYVAAASRVVRIS